MQVANCQVFTLLVIVGLLMFLSSFVTLDLHTSVAELKKLPGHEFFHLPRNRAHVGNYASPIVEGEEPKSISHSTVIESSTIPADIMKPTITTKKKESKNIKQPCSISFESKCRINPIVKYWDEVMECYTSPLREYIGLNAPLKDRKFIVFQPDSGGWNNIRMALEVVILFAQVSGRILVLPPNAVLYLLHLNKRWGDNKSSMEDYFDFDKLRAGKGLETMSMNAFLSEIAMNGLLNTALPNNNTELIRQPLWDYLNKACYTQPWSPGKLYIGFNISMLTDIENSENTKTLSEEYDKSIPEKFIGSFETTDPKRLEEFSLKKKRQLLPYNLSLSSQRAIYFPGAEPNRLLTHYYSMLFFATPLEEHKAKRFMRDRLRYHDAIFCTASVIIEKLLRLQRLLVIRQNSTSDSSSNNSENMMIATQILRYVEDHPNQVEELSTTSTTTTTTSTTTTSTIQTEESEDVRSGRVLPTYVAFHIRRGDFQQKHTRLPAEQIVALTNHLVTDKGRKVAYIATDERNRSFFEPFYQTYGAVYFLSDLQNSTDIDQINQNYIGMIEQVICASADVFIGTPLSTFTAYITRLRGYMNRTITSYPIHTKNSTGERVTIRQPAALLNRAGIYDRTYYFMNHHMYQLQRKPRVHFPLWIRDFIDAFADIDDDSHTTTSSS